MTAVKRTMTRRRFLQLGAIAAGVALVQGCSAPHLMAPAPMPTDAAPPSNIARAAIAYAAQQAHMYRAQAIPGDTSGLYLEQVPLGIASPYAFLWPFSQALAGALDILTLPNASPYDTNLARHLVGDALLHYWDGTAYQSAAMPPFGRGGDRYYDDNAWVGLDLARAYRILGDTASLNYAGKVFQYLVSGWDDNADQPAPGGIFWVEAGWNRDRATASNAPVAELGLRLYQATKDAFYLNWARRIYDWMNSSLMDEQGLYWDRIDGQGSIDTGTSAANQGTMIGAGVMFYGLTHDPTYLDRAKATARAAIRLYERIGLSVQTSFNAIFLRNLLFLSTVDATYLPAARQLLQNYADHCWRENRTVANLFAFPATAGITNLVDQAAMVQLHACLACDPEKYDQLV
jgi:hypothetical protein